tara:strand:+ start:512 stop:685 length:174 start_codon:yes stop_codon:yes gene_type:complete
MMVLDIQDHLQVDGLLEVVEDLVIIHLLLPQEKVLAVDLVVHMRVRVMVQRFLIMVV